MAESKQLWVPADRLLAVVYRNPDWRKELHPAGERNIRRLRSGELEYLSLGCADNILVRLGLEDYWHVPQKYGGLADIYEDGAQYGKPDKSMKAPGPFPRRYGSEEERRAARRAAYRRYRERVTVRQAKRRAA